MDPRPRLSKKGKVWGFCHSRKSKVLHGKEVGRPHDIYMKALRRILSGEGGRKGII